MTNILNFFKGLPVWAMITCLVVGGLLIVLTAVCASLASNGRKNGKDDAANKVAGYAWILGVFAFLFLAAGVLKPISAAILGETPPATIAEQPEIKPANGNDTEIEKVSTPAAVMLNLPDGIFMAPLNRADLDKFLEKTFGKDFDLKELKENYSDDSLPSQRKARSKAIRKALRKYIDANHEGFQDGVWFPLKKALKEYYGAKWDSMSVKERDEALAETMKDVYLEILKNPVYCDMFIQLIYELGKEQPGIIKDNEGWLPAFHDFFEEAFKDPQIGIGACFEPEAAEQQKLILSDEYLYNAVRVVWVIDQFDLASAQIADGKSKVNWHMNHAVLATEARTKKLAKKKDQENLPAIRLVYNYKGRAYLRIGINLFDGRGEIFEVDEGEREKKEVPDDGDDEVVIPSTFSLTIEYFYSTGGKAADGYYKSGLSKGYEYNVTSPTVSGWTPDKPSVIGTMPADDVYVKVVYYKNDAKQYTLTVKYLYEDRTQAAKPYSGKYNAGQQYSVDSPKVAGYTPDIKTVKGKMPAKDITKIVIYKKATTAVKKLTIHYKYKSSGKTAAKDYTDNYKVGEAYSVKSPTIKGYTADKTVVKGTMPNRNVEVTVWYSAQQYRLTIYYNFKSGGKAADTYSKLYSVGAAYNVTSPKVKGYMPDKAVVKGTMPAKNVTVYVIYAKDGDGRKNPDDSVVNDDDPTGKKPTGPNDDNGPGDYQPNKPSENNYPQDNDGDGQPDNKPADWVDNSTDSGNGMDNGIKPGDNTTPDDNNNGGAPINPDGGDRATDTDPNGNQHTVDPGTETNDGNLNPDDF